MTAGALRILQTHDAAGSATPAEYLQPIDASIVTKLGSVVMDVLRPLNPSRTDESGVFAYVDPARGSGWVRLEGFEQEIVARVTELVHLEEITRVVGREPLRNADINLFSAVALRSNNPWVIICAGVVFAVLGGMMAAVLPSTGNPPVLLVFTILMELVAVALILVGVIRAPWWHRARAYARSHGGTLPSDIRGL